MAKPGKAADAAKGGKLPPRQWDVLLRLARQLKEEMLADPSPEQRSVSLPSTGSKLIGGSTALNVTRDEVRKVLVEGFCPRVSLDEKPTARRSGFQEFGLPYASDAAITRYLAAFLTAHRNVALDDVGDGTGAGVRIGERIRQLDERAWGRR